MSTQSVAFFGATGGCAAATLERTIKASIPCSALVRSESKLLGLLAARGLPADRVKAVCTIIQGNITDVSAVKNTLLAANGPNATQPARTIVSGIGGSPQMQWSLVQPVTLDNPTICQFAYDQVIVALQELKPAIKPMMVLVSTTGLSRKARDVPLAFVPLYHWFLAVPHKDKLEVERRAEKELQSGIHAGGMVCVRPSLLLDGPAAAGTRVGWEWFDGQGAGQKEPGPEVGYTITRDSVGEWLFSECINGSNPQQWSGKMVSLTA